ncbi:ABC-2 type transport system permease protein [Streptomyces sp. yr375]|uniref:hypothetical protein n=1 Tax=Streptomyces sp. yr375 TaxID=1761906 RepID=UPI0008C889A4|nr:hypothetical protein [Streptomyces sp. yr375]SES49395.1 ABC-2 type transport system permease protein [Streptomyces sp. yr375]
MVGVLIEMKRAIARSKTRGKLKWGMLALAVFAAALAFSTMLTGFAHYSHRGAGADVLAILSLGWLLGWVTGPVLTGDDSTLRMDYFKLLPIPTRKLAYAMLATAFVNGSLLFSAIAFGGLVAYGAQFGVAAALVGVVAVVLLLVLAVVSSQVALGIFGPVISSRRGRDFGALLVAMVITLLSLASSLVPVVASKLTGGDSPVLSAVVRILPSGWGAVAVDSARTSHWGTVALTLGGLTLLILVQIAIWPALLRRRLTMSSRGNSKAKAGKPHAVHAARRAPLLPATPLGGVIGKELRLYARSMLRTLSLLIAFVVGLLACLIPTFSGSTTMLPFAGLLFTLIAGATCTNLYGDEGSALWLIMVTPGVERADVRGRQYAWLLIVAPIGLLLTLGLTAVSGQTWAWPWVLGGEPAMIGGAAGLVVWASVMTMFPLDANGGPTPARQLKINLLVLITTLTTAPPLVLLIVGTVTDNTALTWTAVPVGILSGVLLAWSLGRASYRRLQKRGPELFSKVAKPA